PRRKPPARARFLRGRGRGPRRRRGGVAAPGPSRRPCGSSGTESQGVRDPLRVVQLWAEGFGGQQVVTDPPREQARDAGRAVVVPIRVVGQPLLLDRTSTALGEREERDQVPSRRDFPGVRRPVTAAADQVPPVRREGDGLGPLEVPEELAEWLARPRVPEL